MSLIIVNYNTTSRFKREELALVREMALGDGRVIGDVFEFRFTDYSIQEELEVDLEKMVAAEVRSAYRALKVPCIVEHAGLVFDRYRDSGYPGGLTKPMWNTLGSSFLSETGAAGEACTARAVIAYCDGMRVRTFVGETEGTLAEEYLGDRKFYWDTVFIPRDDNPGRRTYAQMVERDGGLAEKVGLSQSTQALRRFLEYRAGSEPALWRVGH